MTAYVVWRCAHGHSGIVEDSVRVFATPENVIGFWQAERESAGFPRLMPETSEGLLRDLRAGRAECLVGGEYSRIRFDHAVRVEVDEFYEKGEKNGN